MTDDLTGGNESLRITGVPTFNYFMICPSICQIPVITFYEHTIADLADGDGFALARKCPYTSIISK